MNDRFYEYKKIVEARVAEANFVRALIKQQKIFRVFTDSVIIEQIMRLGVEARVFEPQGDDELRELAAMTLKEAAVNHTAAYFTREALKPIEIRYTSPI